MEKKPISGGGNSRIMLGGFHWPRLTVLVWLLWLVGCSGEEPSGGVQQGLPGLDTDLLVEPTLASSTPQRPRPTSTLPDGKHAVWVQLKQSPGLATAGKTRGWKARGQAVFTALTSNATTSQASLKTFLDAKGLKYKAHWIVNAVRVEADDATIAEIKKRSDVARVFDDSTFEIPKPLPGTAQSGVNAVEWNIEKLRAPEAWEAFGTRGEGVVVANIDTGVQFDHPALVNQYRGSVGDGSFDHNYNWYDPSNVCGFPSTEPCDNAGHGTHTMGTMVGDDGGDNQIGVAPGAKWIAVKGCEDFSCSFEALISAGEWVLAPTDLNGENPRPDLRPQIVNNSWGGGSGDEFYRSVVQAWVAAGIFPAFANGNNGYYGCGTANSPGDYPESYSAGAFDINGVIAGFSSKGPSVFGEIKPNLAAPGVDVRSSVPGGGYEFFSGTSMATPHLAGAVALLWSAAVALDGDVDATRTLLDSAAIDHEDLYCGGDAADNNQFGEGELDVYEALSEAPIGPTGTLIGAVADSSGSAIVGASILASGPFDRKTTSDEAGAFSLRLPVGEYQVTASNFGYLPETESITIEEGVTVELAFTLESAPSFVVEGTLTDSEGVALEGAVVTLLSTPLPTLTTDDSGFFQFPSVPVGEYTLLVSAGGCYVDVEVPVVVSDADQSFALTADFKTDAYGYQCHEVDFDYIEGDTQLDFDYYGGQAEVALPFPFTLYGETYDSVSVTSFGYMAFQSSNYSSSFNTAIPSTEMPNAALYALWDSLSLYYSGGSIYTATVGTAPDRQFVVEWRGFSFYEDSSDAANFELVLHETGEIVMQYLTAEGSLSQGSSATIGIENAAGDDALQYSYNRATVTSETAVLYEVPFSGFVQGVITDANDGLPVSAATVTASNDEGEVRSTKTNSSGVYRLQLTEGEYTLAVAKTNYVGTSADVTVLEGATASADFSLLTARGEITPATIELVLGQDVVRTQTLKLSNTGTAKMTFEVREAGGKRQNVNTSAKPRQNTGANPDAFSAQDLYGDGQVGSVIEPQAPGDVIRSFTPGLGLAWGIGQAQNLWLSDVYAVENVEFTNDGAPTGVSHSAPWSSYWPADMAFDETRNLVCQLAVGGDNGIHCWNQETGDVQETITGSPWANISQRGLAYNPGDDTFFVGGWNEGIIYHVAGVSYGDEAGSVISSCMPPDPTISGLAYNSAMDVLWMATNSPDDTIYELNPYDCTVLSVVGPPQGGGFQGAGLDIDPEGNLWAVAQYPNEVYLVDSGVPSFGDIPWLSVAPEDGTLGIGKTKNLQVTVDTTGLEPGIYLGSIFVVTNSGRQPVLRVPVSLVVSGYLRAINTAGPEYVDSLQDVWEADLKYKKDAYGYVETGLVRTTTHGIGDTVEDTLFKTARENPYGYRFDNVPNGVYQVDLAFAEYTEVGIGDRMFDVIGEDVILLPAHDIRYEVGRYRADDNRFFLEVTDGQLDVRLVASAGEQPPLITSIRVVHRPDR